MDHITSSAAVVEDYSDPGAMWADRILTARSGQAVDGASADFGYEYDQAETAQPAPRDSFDEGADNTPDEHERTEDLVCVYLREMGMTPMLSRESETFLMQGIERGRNMISKALSRSPECIDRLIELGKLLREDELNIRDVVNVRDGEEITE
ncbi:MAG TPA: hypothetical protein VI756_03740, partial [Blastocatellia bacterium]